MGNFVVYKSSAGSGKTYTLVKEYLKLALADPHRLSTSFKHILAVTFTNKAAAEMKERVLRALTEISSSAQTPLANDLQKEMAISPGDLQARCEELHTYLLHQYADFSVFTIDSFVYRIVRRFSLDLKLPANFAVETDEETALWWAIDNLLTGMQENPAVKKLVEAYAEEKVDEQKNWNIENEIYELAKSVLVAKKDQHGAGLLEQQQIDKLLEVKTSLNERKNAFENHLTALAEKAFLIIESNGVSVDDFYYKKSGVPGYFSKLLNKVYDGEELINSYVHRALKEDVWYSGKTPHRGIDSIKDQLKHLIDSIEKFRLEKLESYMLASLLLKNINALCVLSEVKLLVDKYKAEKNVVFISDFNKKVAEFISEEPVPYIYERLGDRYKHYLVDEFQDTSALQWLNLLPLIHNSLSEGKFCMLVGDGKQSIYRWRGADVEQFANLPQVNNPTGDAWVAEQQRTLLHEYSEKQLNVNRRSCREIIQFNNSLFDFLAAQQLTEGYRKVYNNSAQEAASKDGGLISLQFVSEEKDAAVQKVLDETLARVKKSLAEDYRFSDIAVLVRFNRHGNEIANHLLNAGIPVISSDSLLLRNSAEVNFLISFLTWLVNTSDAVAATALLSYLKQTSHPAIGHETIHKVAAKPYLLQEIFAEHSLVVEPARLSALSLFELCTECVRIFQLENRGALYLSFFLDEVTNFSQRESNSLFAFLSWWKQKSQNLSVKIPATTNAVKVLTIHSSKGLEFPVVIFPFADWKIDATENILIDTTDEIPGLPVALVRTGSALKKTSHASEGEDEEQKQKLDNLNLLYVACTRAVDELHIICRETKQSGRAITGWLRSFSNEKLNLSSADHFLETGTRPERHPAKTSGSTDLHRPAFRALHEAVTIKTSDFEDSMSSRRVFGIAIHNILAEVRTRADIELALQKALLQGNIDSSQFTAVQAALQELTNHDQLSRYFDGTDVVKTETELFVEGGDVIRPDRVILCEDHVAVIDFKTGEKKTEHARQIEMYRYALGKISGKQVKAFLVYLPLEVVQV